MHKNHWQYLQSDRGDPFDNEIVELLDDDWVLCPF